MNTYEITLKVADKFSYETRYDQSSLLSIQRELAKNKCVIIGNAIYTMNELVKIVQK